MEEKNYKIYDSLYNVIGVAPYEEVHTQGLLHQVVHFWLAEKKDDQLWFFLQKRASLHPATLTRKKHTKKLWFTRLKNS